MTSKMAEYYEKCYFEYLSRQQWRGYPNLGSVLDAQLVYQQMATRYTQTNWKWCKMAERWGHAKIIKPTHVIHVEDLMDKLNKDLCLLRKMTSNDKMTDTCDLDYNPNDYVYTHPTPNTFSHFGHKYLLIHRLTKRWRNYAIRRKRARRLKFHSETSKSHMSFGEDKLMPDSSEPRASRLLEIPDSSGPRVFRLSAQADQSDGAT
ncbi:hypothetical protein BsWGS_27052 [Bradybaena similaris]